MMILCDHIIAKQDWLVAWTTSKNSCCYAKAGRLYNMIKIMLDKGTFETLLKQQQRLWTYFTRVVFPPISFQQYIKNANCTEKACKSLSF